MKIKLGRIVYHILYIVYFITSDGHVDVHEVDLIVSIKTIRVKSNTKPWPDVNVLNATQNCEKHYEKFK